jgi:hypothetical protein
MLRRGDRLWIALATTLVLCIAGVFPAGGCTQGRDVGGTRGPYAISC